MKLHWKAKYQYVCDDFMYHEITWLFVITSYGQSDSNHFIIEGLVF